MVQVRASRGYGPGSAREQNIPTTIPLFLVGKSASSSFCDVLDIHLLSSGHTARRLGLTGTCSNMIIKVVLCAQFHAAPCTNALSFCKIVPVKMLDDVADLLHHKSAASVVHTRMHSEEWACPPSL